MSTQSGQRDASESTPSRYVVGIDLGTTNCALAYVDSHETNRQVRTFRVAQVVAPFEVEDRETLPSFLYLASSAEVGSGTFKLPWSEADQAVAVGAFAREETSSKPGRVITSAKSWLSHAGVDRTAELLPWRSDAQVQRRSPVEASAALLRHLHDAWNCRFPKHPLSEQDVVITLPASFDEVARELTLTAAKKAGIPRVILVEEPQAAFYAWVDRHAEDWRVHISSRQKILVCDIGGGTTDFTLIRVDQPEGSDDLEFHRIAVGDHLLLGGDNLDLALARHVEQRIAQQQLDSRQWEVLVHSARRAKESLLAEGAPDTYTIHLPAAGSKLIGGGSQVEVSREEVIALLVDGFLPRVELSDRPKQRQSGFQDFGLPFAADAAITRYLSAFLTAHRHTGSDLTLPQTPAEDGSDPARPDIVLLNGGFFASPLLRDRLIEVLRSWFASDDQKWSPLVLDNPRLDLAVAHGAAYFGMVRRGEGVGITATLARSYYVGVAGPETRAICLTPGNAAAGEDFEISDLEFQLTLAEPVEFPIYVSSTRLVDPPGKVIDVDLAELTPLPPIRTVLQSGSKNQPQEAKVHLHVHLSEIGLLELSCREVGTKRSWRLQFDIRSTTQSDIQPRESDAESEGFVDEETHAAARSAIEAVFGPSGTDPPAQLMKTLAKVLDQERHHWPTSLLRGMWETCMHFESGRRRSAAHEARWLNLVGYALRPGYGFAVDDWRVAQTWRTINGKLAFPASQAEMMIVWRRIAGGLTPGQQLGLAEPLLSDTRALLRRFRGGKAKSSTTLLDPLQSAEFWRLLGALELLSVAAKTELGDTIVELLPKRKLATRLPDMLWTLSRLGQRRPLYGPLNTLVPTEIAERWLKAIMKMSDEPPMSHFAAMQLARRTQDRHRDIAEPLRKDVVDWLEARDGAEHLVQLTQSGGTLDDDEKRLAFGESLPSGLRITA